MLIHRWDAARDEEEWRRFVRGAGFGHLVAAGPEGYPVVVPTQFGLVERGRDTAEEDEVILHLARPNPFFEAVEADPRVVMSVAGDWAYIPASWKAIGDEDPAYGIPTTYYAAVQLFGVASVVDDPVDLAALLRAQLATLPPDGGQVDPSEHGARLKAIRGIRIRVTEVRAKFKFGDNVDAAHRLAVVARLDDRAGPGDAAAAEHVRRRLDGPREP